MLRFGSDGPDGDSRVEIHKIRLLKLPKDLERVIADIRAFLAQTVKPPLVDI